MVSLNVTLLMDELKLPLKLNDALLVLFSELRWLLLAVDMLSYAKPSKSSSSLQLSYHLIAPLKTKRFALDLNLFFFSS